MSLLALLAGLLAQYAYPPKGRQRLTALYGRLCLGVARRLDAGDRNSGLIAWFALMALAVIPVALATALAAAVHPLFVWLLEAAFLYGTLRFLSTTGHVAAVERSLREGDVGGAAARLAEWRAEPVEVDDAGAVARLAAEQGLRESHQGTFAPLFWYLLLPGPLGLVVYPLALAAARHWEHLAGPGKSEFGWFAGHAFHAIDWIPQRLTAFAFAVVGNFEDALYCWRSQAAGWVRPEEGIVLASGAGALGVRLGEPIAGAASATPRPPLGQGEPAREEALASLEGLLWRALILWLGVFLLNAALHAA